MESQSRFSEESRVIIDYGRKIQQMNKIFRRERAEFFEILKEEISQVKRLKITFKEASKNKALNLEFDHSMKIELFSNHGLFGFSMAAGKISGAGDEEVQEDEEVQKNHNKTLRPSIDFFIKIPYVKGKKNEVIKKQFEKLILERFGSILRSGDTGRKGKFFQITFQKTLLFNDFRKMARDILRVLKYTLEVLNHG